VELLKLIHLGFHYEAQKRELKVVISAVERCFIEWGSPKEGIERLAILLADPN